MKGLKVTLLAGAALLAMASGSQAATASGGSLSISGLTDYSSFMGYLSKFNPDAGTLTAVTFSVGYGFNSTITVSATTDSTGSVSTRSAAQFDTADAAIKTILNAVVNKTSATIGAQQLNPAAYNLYGTESIYQVGPSFNSSSATYTSTASASNSYAVNSTDFNAFLANSTSSVIDIYGKTLTGLLLSATGGNATASQTTVANQTISLLYTYDPASTTTVPEPASLALLGMGLVGIGAIRRRSV